MIPQPQVTPVPPDTSGCPLSERQCQLVVRSWCTDFNSMYSLTVSVYEHMFQLNPSIMAVFNEIPQALGLKVCDKSLTSERLRQDSKGMDHNHSVRRMSLKLVQSLDLVVRNLARYEQFVRPMLAEIGKNHVKYAERGMQSSHFEDMFQAAKVAIDIHLQENPGTAQKVPLEDETPEETSEAWYVLLRDVLDTTRDNFDKGLLLRDKMMASRPAISCINGE